MTDFIFSSSYFAVALTLTAFAAASAIQKRWPLAIFNPILVAAGLVIGALKLLNVPVAVYQEGCKVLSYLLTPATICLAISFYEQFQSLKAHLGAILAGVLAGAAVSIGSVYLLCQIFGMERVLMLSLLPKSVTTAIGAAISTELGGIAAISTAAIVITGILGNIAGPWLCKIFRLDHEVSRGVPSVPLPM